MKTTDESRERRRRRATRRRLERLDWDFATEQSESPFSAVHWHPCRFPSQVPATAIARLTDRAGVVLDPFMGSGTTLVEAQRLGRKSIGIDISPVSGLIARSKLIASEVREIIYYIDRMIETLSVKWESIEKADVPESVQYKKWYAASTLDELRRLWHVVEVDDSIYADIGRSVFSSILISVCKETRHWGYICDNSEPKTSRVGEARSAFIKALEHYRWAYESRLSWSQNVLPPTEVLVDDAEDALNGIRDCTIDLVVTSPPYLE